ncbi:hypothetical protein AC578_9282 [Pseudocercospora eumusae]|uniref:DUF1989 domain-containing protein n=1 Tax=Pseudocercospora eumusae TaxID=321146 RepID=A0A139HNP4_9PEZI|nr:hypothetical protein AC578_9282 [Pseudocercospora eumusae]
MAFPPSTLISDPQRAPTTRIIKAAHGFTFEVRKGERPVWRTGGRPRRLDQRHGLEREAVDGIICQVSHPQSDNICGRIWIDLGIMKFVDDTIKIHDIRFMSCFLEMYEKQGIENHRSCAPNIAEVMKEHGMTSYLEETDSFNLFQHIDVALADISQYSLKRLGSSKPGDYVEFLAMEDAICAASCCHYDLGGFNGGKITDVAVVTGI